MDEKEKRELAINIVTDMMRTHPFDFVLKVRKKPKCLKIVYEVTEEEMQTIINNKDKQE